MKQHIPYGSHSIDKRDIKAVTRVLSSDWLTQGPEVKKFEYALARYTGSKYAVAASSGTAALHLAYLAGGIGKDDEAITSPNTFVATTNMMLAVGAKPVFCDIRLDTYNIDEEKIEALITNKTKAIVPVHFAGHPCEMDKILAIAKKHNLLVIEDACHALGAIYKGKTVGGIGDMTVFSFHPVKSITTGEGGAVLTNSEVLYKKLLSLRSHGIHKDKNGFNVMTAFGYNYRVTDIQCALGLSQLKKLNGFIKKRQEVVKWYNKYLGTEVILPKEVNSGSSAWHLFVIRTKKTKDRLPLYNFLKENGIGVNFHYPPVYSHPYYLKQGYEVNCHNAEIYGGSAITLPCHTALKKADVLKVSRLIQKFMAYRIAKLK